MTDVQYWKESLEEEIEVLRDLVESIPRKSSIDKAHFLDMAEQKLRSAEGTKRSFKMECRLIADVNDRRHYDGTLSQYEQTLNSLSSEIKSLRASTAKGELFMGADTGNLMSGEEPDLEAAGDALLKDANRMQDQTQSAIDNIARMTEEAKEVGMGTIEELRRQRDQITNIDEQAMKIEDDLKRADKLIRNFGRRMATDRIIQCFACLNILLLVGVIVVSIVRRQRIPGDGFGPTEPV